MHECRYFLCPRRGVLRRFFFPFVALGATVGLTFEAAPAQSASDAVFGINDDNAFRHHYSGSARLLAGLDDVQVGVWTSTNDYSSWPIPQSRGVLVQLLGSPDWASRPAAYAAAALRLVRAHRTSVSSRSGMSLI